MNAMRRRVPSTPPRLRGVTLVELLVAVAISVILLTIAAPAVNEMVLGNRLGSYANDLVATAHLARSEAIKRNAPVTLCISKSGAGCCGGAADADCVIADGWQQGWIVLSGSTVIQRQNALGGGLKISEAADIGSIVFDPTGLGATQATLTICRDSPAGAQERVLSLSTTGRPTVSKTTTGVCP